ncbi:MAG: hypothetical protein A2511_02435 [Deltaproteobacteria bacterium RIFOXYD12_FULL_50_9]|nr:MAG: hypothetical protein A2511_02435 [Deltaproteobacteria bacterium RIFOXYD12_FULL_50_9]
MNIQQTPLAGLKETKVSADTMKEKKLRKACADFESIILQKMLTTMRESVPKSGLLETGFAQATYQSMHDQELAKQLANGKGMGLGNKLYHDLTDKHRLTIKK